MFWLKDWNGGDSREMEKNLRRFVDSYKGQVDDGEWGKGWDGWYRYLLRLPTSTMIKDEVETSKGDSQSVHDLLDPSEVFLTQGPTVPTISDPS